MKGWRGKPAMGRALHRSRIRRYLSSVTRVLLGALGTPDRAWFSLRSPGVR